LNRSLLSNIYLRQLEKEAVSKKKKKIILPAVKHCPIHRLEQALRLWEDRHYVYRLTHEMCQIFPDLQRPEVKAEDCHFDEFRSYLLHSSSGPLDRRFVDTNLIQSEQETQLDNFFPWMITGWMRHSRRTYRVSEDLQMLLEHTSLDDITWNDVPWPFDSFCIELAAPIKDEGQCLYDAILVSEILGSFNEHRLPMLNSISGPDKVFCIGVLGRSLCDVQHITDREKRGAERSLRRRQIKPLISALDKFVKQTGFGYRHFHVLVWVMSKFGRLAVSTSYHDILKMTDHGVIDREPMPTQDFLSHMDRVARITVGLCLYLTMISSHGSHTSDWIRNESHHPDPKAISNEGQICTVSSIHTLTQRERRLLKEHYEGPRGYELCAHFRCGHWRRPPGKGEDPTAPKTVWVKPTLVRRDRLDPGELPGGAKTNIP
jgi:hypothetical protein